MTPEYKEPVALDPEGLLPCPHCKGRATLSPEIYSEENPSEVIDTAGVKCDDCGALVWGDWSDEAIAAWNRRASPSVREIGEPVVKALEWEAVSGPDGVWWRAANPLGGLPHEASTEEDKARKEADFERRVLACLSPASQAPATPPAPVPAVGEARLEPNFAASIAEIIKEESDGGAACGWKACSGCHETNEGYETGHYPYSKMFGCHVGSGCSECGGIGVVWEYWSEHDLKAMLNDSPAAPPAPSGVVEASERAAFEKWAASEWVNGQSVPDNAWKGWQARAALAVIEEQAGWRLVPEEPTIDMTMAACDMLPSVEGVFGRAGAISANVYRAMLSAAPLPVSPKQETE